MTSTDVYTQTNLAAHNFPVQLTSFVGREKELEQLLVLLKDTRLLTLTGAGGVDEDRQEVRLAVCEACLEEERWTMALLRERK